MHTSIKNIFLSLVVLINLTTMTAKADGPANGVNKEIVIAAALANVPGHKLTAVTVEVNPGVVTPSHRHAGFVFVYVLEGTVLTQLDDGEVIKYKAGESWVEPPGTIHSLAENPSKTEKAKILAVFIAREDAQLTTMEKDPH